MKKEKRDICPCNMVRKYCAVHMTRKPPKKAVKRNSAIQV